MEGKELLRLLDFVKGLREEQEDFLKKKGEAETKEAKNELKFKASVYESVANKLEEILRELNQ